MAGTEGFDRPDLHLSETLTTEVGLTTERLLRDERVRSDGTGVHLVFDHVAELEHVGHTHRCLLVEAFARRTIVELRGAVAGKAGLVCPFAEIFEVGTVENGGGELHTEFLTGVTEHGFEHLTDVHTRRYTEGVEDDVDGGTVGQERHIFLTDDLRDDTLVTVATCHLIADADLALLGDVDFGHLDDTAGEFVTDVDGVLLTAANGIHLVVFVEIVDDQIANHAIDAGITRPVVEFDRGEVERL